MRSGAPHSPQTWRGLARHCCSVSDAAAGWWWWSCCCSRTNGAVTGCSRVYCRCSGNSVALATQGNEHQLLMLLLMPLLHLLQRRWRGAVLLSCSGLIAPAQSHDRSKRRLRIASAAAARRRHQRIIVTVSISSCSCIDSRRRCRRSSAGLVLRDLAAAAPREAPKHQPPRAAAGALLHRSTAAVNGAQARGTTEGERYPLPATLVRSALPWDSCTAGEEVH